MKGHVARRARLCGILAASLPAAVAAHPMGNTSVNHYAGITIGRETVTVKYLQDYAELPALRELELVDPNADDRVLPEERETYLAGKTEEVLRGLRLEINGRPRPLQARWSSVTFPPGEGGLSTVRIAWELFASLAGDSLLARNFLVWNDGNHEGTPGWKEIRMSAADDLGISRTSLGWNPTSGELTEYPEEYLWNPPKDTKAWCHFGPGLSPEPESGEPDAEDRPPPSGGSRPPAGLLVLLAALGLAAVAAIAARSR